MCGLFPDLRRGQAALLFGELSQMGLRREIPVE